MEQTKQNKQIEYTKITGVVVAVREKVKKRKGVIVDKRYIYTMIVGDGELNEIYEWYEWYELEPLDIEFGERIALIVSYDDLTKEQVEELANE